MKEACLCRCNGVVDGIVTYMAMYCCASETLQEKRYHHVPSWRCSGLPGVEIVCMQIATGCFPPASAQCAVTTTLDDEEKEEYTVKVG